MTADQKATQAGPPRLREVGRVRIPLDIKLLVAFVGPLIKTARDLTVAHRRAAGISPLFPINDLILTDHIGFDSGDHGEFLTVNYGSGPARMRHPVSYVGPIRTPLGHGHDIGRIHLGGPAANFFTMLDLFSTQASRLNRDAAGPAPEPTTDNLLFHLDDDGRTFVAFYTLPVRQYHR